MTWAQLLARWPLIVADFHEHYRVDLATGVLCAVDAGWFRTRVLGLLSTDSRLAREMGVVIPLNQRHVGR